MSNYEKKVTTQLVIAASINLRDRYDLWITKENSNSCFVHVTNASQVNCINLNRYTAKEMNLVAQLTEAYIIKKDKQFSCVIRIVHKNMEQ